MVAQTFGTNGLKHKYIIDQMWASNAKANLNANMFNTEWRLKARVL